MKPKILFFDIETSPLQAWIWSQGQQYVNHKQLVKGHSRWGIICICYAWNDGKPAKSIDWGWEEQDTGKVIQEFDEVVKTADLIIGKNSKRFDVPMINAARMFAGLPGLPQWALAHDDLEQQMRKYFRVPSQSLDYYSKELGIGGKDKMEMQDWIDIVEKNDERKLTKMIKYCKKDITDTRTLWNKLSEHFDSSFNLARFSGERLACKHANCGSLDLIKFGTKCSGGKKYQMYSCKSCGRYAGKTLISYLTGNEGAIS